MERYIKIAGGKMRMILCLLVWMLVGAACDSFLDIAPSKKTNHYDNRQYQPGIKSGYYGNFNGFVR